jgi:hypothetical protein
MKHIALSSINFDSATQVRAEINHEVVVDYAERMEAGDKFPPVQLFAEKDRYFIGDGWHRLLAAQKNGQVTIPAEVYQGGRREAIKCALGANTTNGLRRTNADKRKAVEIALREFVNLSDRQIADLCGVSAPTVGLVRAVNCKNLTVKTEDRLGADGKIRHLPSPQWFGTDGKLHPEPVTTCPDRIDPLDDEKGPRDDGLSNNLYNLNLYWGRSSKADRREFVNRNRSIIKEYYENSP